MGEAPVLLRSGSLIGLKIDESTLSIILQDILRQQQHLAQSQHQLDQRMGEVLQNYRVIVPRLREVECVLAELGGVEKLSHLYGRIGVIENGMDRVVRNFDEIREVAAVAKKDANQALRSIPQIQESLNYLSSKIDGLDHRHAQEALNFESAVRELQQSHSEHERRMLEALQEVQGRMERLAEPNEVEHLKQMLEELSDRTDENFRSVEASARAVGTELSRHATELNAVRSDVSSIEDKARNRVLGLSNDMEQRYQMLLEAFREYEKDSHDLEAHLVMAGQVLARGKGR